MTLMKKMKFGRKFLTKNFLGTSFKKMKKMKCDKCGRCCLDEKYDELYDEHVEVCSACGHVRLLGEVIWLTE